MNLSRHDSYFFLEYNCPISDPCPNIAGFFNCPNIGPCPDYAAGVSALRLEWTGLKSNFAPNFLLIFVQKIAKFLIDIPHLSRPKVGLQGVLHGCTYAAK